VPIAAFAASGDIADLSAALNQGLDAGLTISDAREVLVQLYAYAGFPRSLNALAELMKVVNTRSRASGMRPAGKPCLTACAGRCIAHRSLSPSS